MLWMNFSLTHSAPQGSTSYPDGSRVPFLKIKAAVVINPGPAEQLLTMESSGSNSGDTVITFPVPQPATAMSIKVNSLTTVQKKKKSLEWKIIFKNIQIKKKCINFQNE